MYVIDAEAATCGKTCRAAQERGLTIQEYLNGDPPKKSVDNKVGSATTISKPVATKDIIKKLNEKNFISIRISNSCKLIDYCPTIKELADLYDNTNKNISGHFYYDESKDTWAREPPTPYNSFEYYKLFFNNLKWVLWVDPSEYEWRNSKTIMIVPHLDYLDDKDGFIDRTRTEYHGLYLDECARAIIGWKDNGQAILLDVLNHYYSNCAEPVKYDPKVEIFVDSKIFKDCDRECMYYKKQMQNIDKAFYQTENEFEEAYQANEYRKSTEKTCYGIYCDKKFDESDLIPDERPLTFEEKIRERELKEQYRKQRLAEIEDTQRCESLKRDDDVVGRAQQVDCSDDDEREEYLKERDSPVQKEEVKKETGELPKKKDIRCKGTGQCFTGFVTKIRDGDTIEVSEKPIRLALTGSPELTKAGGKEAKLYTEQLCPIGSLALVDQDDGQLAGSFDRMIGVVYCGNFNLNKALLETNHGEIDTKYCSSSEFSTEDWARKHGC